LEGAPHFNPSYSLFFLCVLAYIKRLSQRQS
jgi:hypothetical protein